MILIELMLAAAFVCFALLLLPFLLLMAGVAGVVILTLLAPAVVLALVAGWLLFPGLHTAVLVLLLCFLGLLLLERRSRDRAYL